MVTNIDFSLLHFLHKSARKVYQSIEEASEDIFFEDIKSDIIPLPFNVDELTDVECFDDYELTTPSVKDLLSNIKISVPVEEIGIKEVIFSLILRSGKHRVPLLKIKI